METTFWSPKMEGSSKEQLGTCVSRTETDQSGVGPVMVEELYSICSSTVGRSRHSELAQI